ncbi:hypothetical protein GTA08_BOTSDO10884 [Botryosphaeria dothidea]|uniref:Uncharacterized protein n=1 Tax=Botryosphaeria dothidea TaxID=55169 RepID=A0A8H4IIF2_9PEZI|nr:hypothetical protein GTA08_BOTSDO10884 [Botryosphaeria dothidea]
MEKGHVDGAFLDGDLEYRDPADHSFDQHKSWKRIPSDRNSDYFQMCLVEIGFRKIARQWEKNMEAIDDACRDFNNRVHVKIHSNTGRSAYWRGGVDKDLLNAYKLQTRLETLQINLFYVIDRKEGVWHNFRDARPRKRQGEVYDKRNKTDEEEAEYRRIKFLLFFCAEMQADRLYSFRERIKVKIEELRTLRELMAGESQNPLPKKAQTPPTQTPPTQTPPTQTPPTQPASTQPQPSKSILTTTKDKLKAFGSGLKKALKKQPKASSKANGGEEDQGGSNDDGNQGGSNGDGAQDKSNEHTKDKGRAEGDSYDGTAARPSKSSSERARDNLNLAGPSRNRGMEREDENLLPRSRSNSPRPKAIAPAHPWAPRWQPSR